MSEDKLDFMINVTDFMIGVKEEIGPRPPCSEQEKKAADYFFEKLKESCNEVCIEDFNCHPGAFKASFGLPVILHLIALILYWHYPWFCTFFALIAFLIQLLEGIMKKDVIDFLFPNKSSQNVLGKIKPRQKRKKLIIIGSHLDSGWEFPLMKKLGKGSYMILVLNLFSSGLLGLLSIFKNLSIFLPIGSLNIYFELAFYGIILGLIPLSFLQLLFIISGRTMMGANEDLSGMAVCHELAKYFGTKSPKHAEIWINGYGSQKIGSKGSKAFIEKHGKEIQGAKIVNLKMIGLEDGKLIVGNSKNFGLVNADEDMVELITSSARKMEHEIEEKSLIKFTDSLHFNRCNFSAASISTERNTSKKLFRQKKDDVLENVDIDLMEKVFEICIELINQLDGKD